jgi:hypothetical protein
MRIVISPNATFQALIYLIVVLLIVRLLTAIGAMLSLKRQDVVVYNLSNVKC